MDCWRHVLWCSSARIHVIVVGWSIERFGGQARWQTCSRSGTSFWSRCAQSIDLHFLFAVYTYGVHGKIGYLSIRELVDAWCAVPGLRARDGGGLPCNCRRLVCRVLNSRQEVQRSISLLLKVITVPFEVGEFIHATSERASWMSNLRSFLRLAVSRFMALVRPRDCGSLTGGMVDDPLWRHALCSLIHRQ